MNVALAASLTLGNALCGFAGIAVLLTDGAGGLATAAVLVFAAWGFDVCDGMAARALGAQSSFGALLDSLCDVVSFGMLPAALVLLATRAAFAWLAVAAAAVYLLAEILRLARFTTRAVADSGPSRLWFAGLPCSVGGMSVAAVTLWAPAPWAVAATALVLAALMLSTLPYVHLVKLFARRRAWLWTLVVPAVACVVYDWRTVLAAAFGAYLVSGALVSARRECLRA